MSAIAHRWRAFFGLGVALSTVLAPADVAGQDRSIFSVLDTGGRSVAASMSLDGVLSESDVLSAGGRRVQAWSLSTAPGAELQVDLRSVDFDAFLYVVGPGLGEGLRDDDSGDGLNSRLCLAVSEPGEYRVVASSLEGNVGSFTLEVTELAPGSDGICPESEAGAEITDLALLPTEGRLLSLGDDTEGVLLDTDPIVFDAPAQAWAVEGRVGQDFSVDLISDAFDAFLMLEGPGLEVWLDDDDGAGRCDSRITFTFPETGTYRVVVSTLGSAGGSFRLVATEQAGAVDPGACVVPSAEDSEPVEMDLDAILDIGTLTYEVAASGTMTGGEGFYAGRSLQGWTLEGSAGDLVAIELRSADFDSYLYLSGPGFPDPLSDDDGAGDFHSRICVELSESGTYRVLAGPLSGNSPGDRYTLTALRRDAESLCDSFEISPTVLAHRLASLPTEGRSLSVGEEIAASIDLSALRHPETNQLIQAWSLAVEAGQTIFVDVVSGDFDPMIYVAGPGIDGLLFVDDAGDGCNTRIQIDPTLSGTVTLLPGSFYEEASGDFLLRASTDPPTLESGGCVGAEGEAVDGGTAADPAALASISSGEARRLDVGTEVEGSLDSSDEVLSTGLPAQPWTVMVQAGDELTFELLSEDFDPVLYLDGLAISAPFMDDDGAGSLNSRIMYTATESGLVRLVVTALTNDGAGSFRLRVIRRVR